jgi:hypothetical protein
MADKAVTAQQEGVFLSPDLNYKVADWDKKLDEERAKQVMKGKGFAGRPGIQFGAEEKARGIQPGAPELGPRKEIPETEYKERGLLTKEQPTQEEAFRSLTAAGVSPETAGEYRKGFHPGIDPYQQAKLKLQKANARFSRWQAHKKNSEYTLAQIMDDLRLYQQELAETDKKDFFSGLANPVWEEYNNKVKFLTKLYNIKAKETGKPEMEGPADKKGKGFF